MKRFTVTLMIIAVLLTAANANNIQVSAPTLTGENRTDGYVYVTFDLSWANSWRGTEANNWDAAWVFVKYRVGTGEWKHAKLHNSGHIVGSGTPATLEVGLRDDKSPFEPTGNPGVGAFIYRSAEGFGTFNTTANKLRWNYTAEGITTGATVEVRVFAIEMVYVREGEFSVGGAGGFDITIINTPDARVTPSGGLAGYPGYYDQSAIQPQSSNWPNGYNSYYCMKYEASQQQIVDFYNTLTLKQYNNIRSGGGYRDMITYNNPGSITTNLPDVACSAIGPHTVAAYADWAGLRPMTELEYEKACRGPLPPLSYEFAWGTNEVVANGNYNQYQLSYMNTESEGISLNYDQYRGNANHFNTNYTQNYGYLGPFRVGIFAANGANTGRVTSGASYWGIMELSGNVWEQCVSLYNLDGRKFEGNHGDGLLQSNGYHNQADWPTDNGLLPRGGSFSDDWYYLIVSYRPAYNNSYFSGIRAVRSHTAQ